MSKNTEIAKAEGRVDVRETRSRMPRSPVVNVEVTEETISHAAKRDSQHCMIADAVRAAFPDAKAISVDLATIRFTDPRKGLRYTYLTPRMAQVELVKFDQGIKTQPFKFRLRAAHVSRSGRKGAPRTAKQVKANRRSIEKAIAANPLNRSKLARGNRNTVADRVGGDTPPLQIDSETKLPFSRRRAFGLRGLVL
jgi:hypothetical protein